MMTIQRIRQLIDGLTPNYKTGNAFVDGLYQESIDIVGHPNPYYTLFYQIALETKPRLVVELGSWRGFAAAHFAAGGAQHVITIDIHREDKFAQQRCIEVARTIPAVEYLHGWTWDTHVLSRIHDCAPIDILYIDAWHEYQYAMKEWDIYKHVLQDDALVICDDIFDAPGATVDMVRFWDELPLANKHLDDTIHPGIPMGFGLWWGWRSRT